MQQVFFQHMTPDLNHNLITERAQDKLGQTGLGNAMFVVKSVAAAAAATKVLLLFSFR